MIKLAIFDLDGTLIDSLGDLAAAVEYVLAQNGYPPNPFESYRYFVGNGAMKLIERALPEGTGEAEIKRIHEAFSTRYREHCLDLTKPYDRIPEMLTKLKDAGIKLAVASNKPDEFSKKIVEQVFGVNLFDSVHGKRDGVPTKPSREIVDSIMCEQGTLAEETIFIGDSDVDVQTARNAGIKCIGCAWGFRGAEELKNAGADFIAYNSNDIDEFLLEAVE
ncbi:MAG: HAD family hydrolase [Ruminococcus sp.]|nr:HAD family hydrolase [Ruminococcus sp.]